MNAPDKSPAQACIASIDHWIGGKVAAGRSGRAADVFNPATGVVTGKVALASNSEVDAAVASAQAAFPAWAARTTARRGQDTAPYPRPRSLRIISLTFRQPLHNLRSSQRNHDYEDQHFPSLL